MTRVLKFFAVAMLVMAASRAWAEEEVTYDQTTGALTLVQALALDDPYSGVRVVEF